MKVTKIITGQTELGCRVDGLEVANIYNPDGSLRLDVLDTVIES